MDEFNKRCAEVLGWKRYDEQWYVPNREHCNTLNVNMDGLSIFDMHFHDSYDWAMLLVKKLMADNPPNKLVGNAKLMEFLECCEWYYATPHQIAQEALEVLEANNG